MKKIIFLILAISFVTSMVLAQEKVVVPVLNVGDKMTYRADNGWEWTSEIISDEKDSYVGKTIMPEGRRKGEWKRVYSKKNFNCIKAFKDGKEDKEERDRIKKYFDFPLYPGKKWSYRYDFFSERSRRYVDSLAELSVEGLEEIEVPAGKFKSLKVKVKYSFIGTTYSGISYYWWCPELKGVIKTEFEPSDFWRDLEYQKIELISYELK